MTIIIALLLLSATGITIASSTSWESNWNVVGHSIAIIFGCLLVVASITVPINRYCVHAEIQQYKSVQQTLSAARANNLPIESAAFQIKVADMNQWRADRQFWNGTIFSVWVPNEIMDLEPIQ